MREFLYPKREAIATLNPSKYTILQLINFKYAARQNKLQIQCKHQKRENTKERACESERDISGFHPHTFYPPTQPLFPPTLPPTHLLDNLMFPATSQDQHALKKSLTAMDLGRYGSS